MSVYIYQRPDWPQLKWDAGALTDILASARHKQGRFIGRMESLGFEQQQEAVLQTLTQDVLKSSEIEGETLDAAQVRSSIARRLGMDIGALAPVERNVEGVVEMTLDATRRYTEPLTVTRLHDWHAALFPTGRSGMNRIKVGAWRDDAGGPMQVLSGPHGHERVHYQAPPAANLNAEITAFLSWLNSPVSADMVIKAALAHLWFVTIHPFDDGNGRIARAIADMVLAQSEGTSQRFYSLSAQIRRERRAYYDILEQTQKSTLDVTQWLQWFLGCFDRTLEGAATAVESVLAKARVWKRLATVSLNDRQRMVINRLLDGFDGKLTTSKWAKLTKTSQDTALRDIQQLLDQGVLVRNSGGGRSSSYRLSDSGSTSAND